jgi:translation initiation factor IF-2
MATATQSLDEDTFKLLGAELGYVIEVVSPEDEEKELFEPSTSTSTPRLEESDEELLVARPAGRHRHGSRRPRQDQAARRHPHTNVVAARPAASPSTSAPTRSSPSTRASSGRSPSSTPRVTRRSPPCVPVVPKVTDIAILVVAADDGVMPQTIEALNHAQAADVPIVVAVNKIDKEGANPAKIRQQLTEYNLVAEEYGGDTMFVDVSARRAQHRRAARGGPADGGRALDLRANPDKDARGVAIEANLDRAAGATATVLVQQGTLRVGDAIVAGSAHGRVRAMLDEHGNNLDEATPSRPVQVLGLSSVPRAGDTFVVAPTTARPARSPSKREAAERQASLAKARKRISLEDLNEALASWQGRDPQPHPQG